MARDSWLKKESSTTYYVGGSVDHEDDDDLVRLRQLQARRPLRVIIEIDAWGLFLGRKLRTVQVEEKISHGMQTSGTAFNKTRGRKVGSPAGSEGIQCKPPCAGRG